MNIFVHSTLHWRKSLAPLNNPTVQNIMVIIVIIKIIIIVIKIIVLSSSSLSFSIIINSPDRQPLISSLLPNHQYCIREEGFIGKCIPRGRRDFPREIYFPMHPDSRQCTSILWALPGKYWHMVCLISYSFQVSKRLIEAVSFFLTSTYFWWRTQNFRLRWLCPAITRVQNIGAWKTITFSDSSGRQLSHGTPHVGSTRSECPVNVGKTKKYHFLGFWASWGWKQVGGWRSDNLEATAPAHSSFWLIFPKFLRDSVENDHNLKVLGLTPRQSWKNQNCVRKRTWF